MRKSFLVILVVCAFPLAAQQPCSPPAYVDFEALSSEAIYGDAQLDSDVEVLTPMAALTWKEAFRDVDNLLGSLPKFTPQLRQNLANFDKEHRDFSARFRIRVKLIGKLAR